MGKIKERRTKMLKRYVKEYGDKYFSTNGEKVYCNVCETEVTVTKKSQLEQHHNTLTHINKALRFDADKNA